MHDIFISYAREDAEWVERLCRRMEAQGFSVWKDSAIPTGRAFGRVIEQAIEAASVVVVVWSKHSVESDWVRAEAMEGLKRNILVPLLKEQCEPPLRYRTLQTSDLTRWRFQPRYPAFLDLLAACREITGGRVSIQSNAQQQAPAVETFWSNRRQLAIAGVTALALLVALGIWKRLESSKRQQSALSLTVAAESILNQLESEQRRSRLYWRFFLDRKAGQASIERAVLLSLEAVARDPSPRTLQVLESGLRLLPLPRSGTPGYGTTSLATVATGGSRVAWAHREIIQQLDLNHPSALTRLENSEYVSHLQFLSGSYPLMTVGVKGAIDLWKPHTGERRTLNAAAEAPLLSVALADDGNTLALHQQGFATIWELGSGQLKARIATESDPLVGNAQSIALAPDGRRLAIAGRQNIQVRDLMEEANSYELNFEYLVSALSFDPAGTTLASASTSGENRIIEVSSGKVSQIFQGLAARTIHFSDNGEWVVRSASGRVAVAKATRQQAPILTYSHDDSITAVAFSTDGRHIATGGRDGVLRVWNLNNGRELLRQGFLSKVLDLGFSSDGTLVTAVSGDGEIRQFPLTYEDPAAAACQRIQRQLTIEEWRNYLPEESYRVQCPDLGQSSSPLER